MGSVHPSELLQELRRTRETGELAEICAARGIRLLVAFGSAVHRPDAAKDLDLAIMVDAGRDLPGVAGEIIGWLRSDAVDVLDLREADVVARYEALAKGELLHEQLPGLFYELQIAAVLRFADTQWLRDLQLEVLAR